MSCSQIILMHVLNYFLMYLKWLVFAQCYEDFIEIFMEFSTDISMIIFILFL